MCFSNSLNVSSRSSHSRFSPSASIRPAADAVAPIRIARSGALRAFFQCQHQGAVGEIFADRKGVDLPHRLDPETAAYLARKQAEGKSRREALRCLKRHLARRIWRLLQPPHTAVTASPMTTATPPARPRTIHCNLPRGNFSLT